ncbi:MAG: peptide ABC transporter substrate-binding protein [Pyrinomonadaceae bacterium]
MIAKRFTSLFCTHSLIALVALSHLSCTQIQKPVTQPFFAATAPPEKQELRWSNGKHPKSFDPALASAAPETDIVRAIFEGLTELDARSLEAVPAAAERWSVSADNRVWTFDLRKDARWSNGKRVTAHDFVASWKRLQSLGEKTAHYELLHNIVGFPLHDSPTPAESTDFAQSAESNLPATPSDSFNPTVAQPDPPRSDAELADKPKKDLSKFGVEAVNDVTLTVTLTLPDKDLPKLVANPIFRPVYGDGAEFGKAPTDKNIVTNGAFTLIESNSSGVVIERSNTYWNKLAVKLERIRFVPMETAEAALGAYKKGEIDAVTNAHFEPLALKLLAPFEDFRRTKHSALNYYEFNSAKPPFSDRRVREALAIAIDRERLIETELDGTAQPATDFLPHSEKSTMTVSFDAKKASGLLEKAGYPNGLGFPQVQLVINRNNTQQRVANAVAKMWKQHLNLSTKIVTVETSEIETVRNSGNFDLIRRGVVLPTTDEVASLTAIFRSLEKKRQASPTDSKNPAANKTPEQDSLQATDQTDAGNEAVIIKDEIALPELMTREDALFDLLAIPLYFPESYALIKPYVYGFDTNALDAPSIKHIGINNNWQPPKNADQN